MQSSTKEYNVHSVHKSLRLVFRPHKESQGSTQAPLEYQQDSLRIQIVSLRNYRTLSSDNNRVMKMLFDDDALVFLLG